MSQTVHSPLERTAIRVIFLIGVGMALFELLYNRSFWTDESAIAMNIVDRGYLGLLKPLDTYQMAPILWLWVVETFSHLVPDSEVGMRLPSFLAYLGTLYVFLRFLGTHLRSGVAIAFGIALFVFNRSLLIYATELKQYGVEAFVALFLAHVALEPDMEEGRRMRVSTLGGCLGILLSTISVIVLPAVMAAFWLRRWGRWDASFVRRSVGMGLAWAVVFIANYLLFLHEHPSNEYKMAGLTDAFPPSPANAKAYLYAHLAFFKVVMRDFAFSFKNIIGLTRSQPEWPNLGLMAVLLGIGLWGLARRSPLLLLVLVPTLMHVLLATLHIYPYVTRLYLHSYPFVCFVAAAGADKLIGIVGKRAGRYLAGLFLAGSLVMGLLFIPKNLAREVEESKPVLRGVSARARPGEPMHVYIHAGSMYTYYVRTGRFEPVGPVTGSRLTPGAGWREQYAELPVSGGPFWVFFAHIKDGDDRNMLDSAVSAGMRVTDSVKAQGASAYRIEPGRRR
jgi:hypothetical protein